MKGRVDVGEKGRRWQYYASIYQPINMDYNITVFPYAAPHFLLSSSTPPGHGQLCAGQRLHQVHRRWQQITQVYLLLLQHGAHTERHLWTVQVRIRCYARYLPAESNYCQPGAGNWIHANRDKAHTCFAQCGVRPLHHQQYKYSISII